LCSGTLTLSRARPPDRGPTIRWIQDPQNPADGDDDKCGSLPGQNFEKLPPGLDVMITTFSDFCQISAKQIAFFTKTKCYT
jgi:hypothetical protein